MTLPLPRPVALFGLFSMLTFHSLGQDWPSIPWSPIGDSTRAIPGRSVLVTGQITSVRSKEPVVGASVSIDLLKYFDYTDSQGKYLLELPPGRYRIIVRHLGMVTVYKRLNIRSSGLFDINMEEGVTGLEEVVISARAIDANVKESIPGINKISVQEIKALPTFMGDVDILKTLQTLPGVSSVGEGSSGFNVRGARADQNLVLLDGAPIFNPSHALGFVSGLNQDMVNNFTLYKGNVPANLGGRAASVLEVTTRQGDLEKWKYQGGAGLISSRFLAEGPIVKNKASILLAGRTSYADWVLRRVKDPNVRNSSLLFYDAHMNLVHRPSQSSSLKWNAYSSKDFFRFSQQFAYSWENYLSSFEWKSFTEKKVSPTLSAAFGQYRSTLIDPSGIDASQLSNRLNYLQVKQTASYVQGDRHSFIAGAEATAYLPAPEKTSSYNGNPAVQEKRAERNKGVEAAVFINEEYEVSAQISLQAGLRYSLYRHIGPATSFEYQPGQTRTDAHIIDTLQFRGGQSLARLGGFEPRLSARISLAPAQSIKVGYARMRQYIHQISNTTAPTPVDLWQVSTKYLPAQVADNFSLGYFVNFEDNLWETSVEVFYKPMFNLVEYKDFASLYLNPHIETELLTGEGRAYGAELYIRKLKGAVKGWLSYTYANSSVRVKSPYPDESINNGQWYPANYNKPHTFNLVFNTRGLHPNGAISCIVSYNTGRPLTALETSYLAGTTVVPVYSDRNKYKIPDYFRFDFSFTLANVIDKIDDTLVVSVYNVFGRENAYSVFYQRPAANYYIPKPYKLAVLGSPMPSITYNFKF